MHDAQKILVVDDEPSIVEAVATALRYEGYDVGSAAIGVADGGPGLDPEGLERGATLRIARPLARESAP